VADEAEEFMVRRGVSIKIINNFINLSKYMQVMSAIDVNAFTIDYTAKMPRLPVAS
jgi:hypothetical protein